MASYKIAYGTRTAFSQEDNIHGLTTGQAKPLGEVDNSATLALDYMVFFRTTLNASGVSATGTIELYLIEKDDSGADKWTDAIDADGTSNIASSIKNAKLLEILAANSNSQEVICHFRLGDYIAHAPKYWSIVVYNKSGATLDADDADSDAQYTAITGTIA